MARTPTCACRTFTTTATKTQRHKYLPKLCSGEWVGALAMSEPGAGSDVVGSMSCKPSCETATWIANGNKMWITNGPEADVLIVYMRTAGKEAGSRCMTAFIVEKACRAFTPRRSSTSSACAAPTPANWCSRTAKFLQKTCLGEVNHGVKVLMSGLNTERLVLYRRSARSDAGRARLTLPYVRERKQFDHAIGTFGMMQAKVADMYTALAIVARLCLPGGTRLTTPASARASTPRAACCTPASRAVEVALEAIQALGGNGYINEYATGRFLRDAKLYAIGAGTNEIRRMLIGRELV